jgi:hypothetical protein
MRSKSTNIVSENKNLLYILLGTACILSIPLIAMQFTPEVDWSRSDFVIIGALLLGTGFTYELIARRIQNTTHRLVLGIMFAVIVLFIWAELAVGILNIPGISGS